MLKNYLQKTLLPITESDGQLTKGVRRQNTEFVVISRMTFQLGEHFRIKVQQSELFKAL